MLAYLQGKANAILILDTIHNTPYNIHHAVYHTIETWHMCSSTAASPSSSCGAPPSSIPSCFWTMRASCSMRVRVCMCFGFWSYNVYHNPLIHAIPYPYLIPHTHLVPHNPYTISHTLGTPTGSVPHIAERSENYRLVFGSKYATEAERVGREGSEQARQKQE
ncbi:hypothetical protein EON63_14685, partial [archaeon]